MSSGLFTSMARLNFNKKCDEIRKRSSLSGHQMAHESQLSDSAVTRLQQITMEHRVSNPQLEELLDYLAANPALAKGVGLGARSKETIDREWNDLAQKLNAHGSGASKTGQRWKRYWADIKHKAKSRAAAKRRDASGTGGGPSTQEDLSETDKKILGIIGEAAVFGDSQHRVPVFDTPIEPSQEQNTFTEDYNIIMISEPEAGPSISGVEPISPSRSGQTTKYIMNPPLADNAQPDDPNVHVSALQSDAASPAMRSRPQVKRSLFPKPNNSKKSDRTKVTKVEPAWVVELETRRIAAEEKLADAVMIIAEAARTNAESARINAECARMHCEIMAHLAQTLRNNTNN